MKFGEALYNKIQNWACDWIAKTEIRKGTQVNVILCKILYHLYRMLLLFKLQAEACDFTKSNTLPWVFFTFFKLYECYQIAQSVSNKKPNPTKSINPFMHNVVKWPNICMKGLILWAIDQFLLEKSFYVTKRALPLLLI